MFKRRLISLTPRDLQASVGADGIGLRAAGRPIGAPWSEVVGVGTAPGIRDVVLADGRNFPLVAAHFKDGDALLRSGDSLAGDRLFRSDPDTIFD